MHEPHRKSAQILGVKKGNMQKESSTELSKPETPAVAGNGIKNMFLEKRSKKRRKRFQRKDPIKGVASLYVGCEPDASDRQRPCWKNRL